MRGRYLVALVVALAGIISACSADSSDKADSFVHSVQLQSVERAAFNGEAGAVHLDLRYEPTEEEYPDVSCTLIAADGSTYRSPFSFAVIEPGLLRKHIRTDGGVAAGDYAVECRSGMTEVFGQVTIASTQ